MINRLSRDSISSYLKAVGYAFVRWSYLCVCACLLLLMAPVLDRSSPDPVAVVPIEKSPTANSLSRLGIELKRGDTLLGVLTRYGVKPISAHELIAKIGPLFNLKKLRSGDRVDLVIDQGDRSVQRVEIDLEDKLLRAKAVPQGWTVEHEAIPFTVQTRTIRGEVFSSLYENGLDAGLTPEQILELAKIFEYDIDFFSDFRKGDDFAVIVEEQHYENGRRSLRRILAADLETAGTANGAFYFMPRHGAGGYYDAEGKQLRRSFLRAPLSYSRISSFFSVARRHPIFRTVRPHMAIDYAAPMGTPVVAIGKGRVQRSGWYAGYGKFIEIAHGNGYTSRYGHFSRIARGIRRGVEVNAGEVIGFVGQTGHATGPHLHFEFLRGGRKINFLSLKIPRTEQLTRAELERFQREREARLATMDELQNSPS